jgi:hypothetical protein
LLVQEVAAQSPGRVTFVRENFGASALADRFGVKGYPAVFVDDILVASPREFGYFGEVEGSGRYAPWRSEANQAKFKSDLTRMIDLILAGRKTPSAPNTRPRQSPLANWPRFPHSNWPTSPENQSPTANSPAASSSSSSGPLGVRPAGPLYSSSANYNAVTRTNSLSSLSPSNLLTIKFAQPSRP